VPGFESGEDVEDLAFDRVMKDEAIAIAAVAYNLDVVSALRLDSNDVFKVRPPLVFSREDADRLLEALSEVLA
jgi:4-aminobutyrate aminotransferase-like enzyme